jgi:hypothetical protein
MFKFDRMPGVVCLAALILLVGCGRGTSTTPASEVELPAELILSEPPAVAVDVKTALASAREGDDIVVRGRVGGRGDPLVAGRAVMTILDLSVATCDANSDDNCRTPWDACCEDPATVRQSTAVVQVVGPDGQPLRAGLRNFGGIRPMAQVIVQGTARRGPDGKTLLIDASGLHVTGP